MTEPPALPRRPARRRAPARHQASAHRRAPAGTAIRCATFALVAPLIWQLTAELRAPSERFHAALPFLWLAWLALHGWRRFTPPAAALSIGSGLGMLLATTGWQNALSANNFFAWSEAGWQALFNLSFLALFAIASSAAAQVLQRLIPAAAHHRLWPVALRWSLALVLLGPYYYACLKVHPGRSPNDTDPQRALHLPFRNLNFRASDGTLLRAWFIPASGSQGIVVLVHGQGANRGAILDIAQWLHRAGFGCLLFDMRAHGDSAGHTTSFGIGEALDVAAAAKAAGGLAPPRSVGLYAVSMGGAAAIEAFGVAPLPQVRAVCLDSAYARFGPLIDSQFGTSPGLLASAVHGLAGLELGIPLASIEPEKVIQRIAPRPLLLICGTADSIVPPQQARWNFAAARAPKQLLLFRGAGHCEGAETAPAAYQRRVIGFFRAAFQPRQQPSNTVSVVTVPPKLSSTHVLKWPRLIRLSG